MAEPAQVKMGFDVLCEGIDLYSRSTSAYQYIYDMNTDVYHIAPDALERFSLPSNHFGNVLKAHEDFVHPDDLPALVDELTNLATSDRCDHDMTYRWLSRDGEPVWINCKGHKSVSGEGHTVLCGCVNEVGREQLADSMTGLLHSRVLLENFDDASLRAFDGCFLLFEVRDYRPLMSSNGYDWARWAAKGLSSCISKNLSRNQDAYAYGDSGILVVDYSDSGTIDARVFYEKVRMSLGLFFGNEPSLAPFDVTCGIVASEHVKIFGRKELSALLRFANDTAKKSAGNSSSVLETEKFRQMLDRRSLLPHVKEALKAGEFTFFLQPKMNIFTGKVIGSEALARWIDRDGNQVPPGRFIPVMEESGLISDLDIQIWNGVCKTLHGWLQAGIPTLPISINVSREDILKMDVPTVLNHMVKRYGLPRYLLEIEITESAFADTSGAVAGVAAELRKSGFTLLIDDFGSGYSSLNMLKDMDVNILKMDMNFLDFGDSNADKGIDIVQSVVKMAHTLNLPVIAEGVENEDQADVLRFLGCYYAQGFNYYEAMEVSAFEKLLADPSNYEVAKRSDLRSRRSYLDEISEYFWKVAEVNPLTGDFHLISVQDDLEDAHEIYAATVMETADRVVERGHIHPDDVERYKGAFALESLASQLRVGEKRRKVAVRYRMDKEYVWRSIESMIPASYSQETPCLLFTWRDSTPAMGDAEGATALATGAADHAGTQADTEEVQAKTEYSLVVDLTEQRVLRTGDIKAFGRDFGFEREYPYAIAVKELAKGIVLPEYQDTFIRFFDLDRLLDCYERGKRVQRMDYCCQFGGVTTWVRAILLMRQDEETDHVLMSQRLFSIDKNKNQQVCLQNLFPEDPLDNDLRMGVEELLDLIPGGLFVYEAEGEERVFYINSEVLRIFGCNTMEEFISITGGSFKGMVHPEDLSLVESSIRRQVNEASSKGMAPLGYVTYRIIRKDGTTVRIQDYGRRFIHSDSTDLYCVFISETQEGEIEALRRMGTIDFLTDLKNRNAYEQDSALYRNGSGMELGCIYVDVNGLHETNNTLGHDAGDELLKATAKALKSGFDPERVYRIGGDEFVVLCDPTISGMSHNHAFSAIVLAKEVLAKQGKYVSYGFAWTDRLADYDELLHVAERRMFEDKKRYYLAHGDRRR